MDGNALVDRFAGAAAKRGSRGESRRERAAQNPCNDRRHARARYAYHTDAAGKRAALTYEPAALPDGTLAGARPGSGNFAITIRGRSAHAGRNPEDGRNALVANGGLMMSVPVR